eukprot:scaffold17535_cov103-Isochrysis_galbana.AAC.1
MIRSSIIHQPISPSVAHGTCHMSYDRTVAHGTARLTFRLKTRDKRHPFKQTSKARKQNDDAACNMLGMNGGYEQGWVGWGNPRTASAGGRERASGGRVVHGESSRRPASSCGKPDVAVSRLPRGSRPGAAAGGGSHGAMHSSASCRPIPTESHAGVRTHSDAVDVSCGRRCACRIVGLLARGRGRRRSEAADCHAPHRRLLGHGVVWRAGFAAVGQEEHGQQNEQQGENDGGDDHRPEGRAPLLRRLFLRFDGVVAGGL